MTEVASLVTTMAAGPAISVEVGGAAVTAASMDPPAVFTEPDVDCVGAWTDCASNTQSFDVTTVASGANGQDCAHSFNEQRACGVTPAVKTSAAAAAAPVLVLGAALALL